jgi:hypothetical protein
MGGWEKVKGYKDKGALSGAAGLTRSGDSEIRDEMGEKREQGGSGMPDRAIGCRVNR